MGLFGKENCCICGEKGKQKIADGFLCKECFKKYAVATFTPGNNLYGLPTKLEVERAIESKDTKEEELKNFNPTKKILKLIEFDDDNKKFIVLNGFNREKVSLNVYNYSDVIEYELLENGETVTKGGIGRALAGGVLFGGVGAVVGGVTAKRKTKAFIDSLKIKITLNNLSNPSVYVNLIQLRTKSNSSIYKMAYSSAQEILSILSIIVKDNEDGNLQDKPDDAIQQVKGLKELLDLGAITEEEFNTKKKELLNL
ncbi:TPA: SHOCT domain-containing protein [Clostridioides difficile]|uniref:SHOCT domain-containing protein n=1 Tax=Clostridioides difficile TaxID=1496 RepID=UPI0007BC82E5|nr:SHOCT domain-containing protein [Clostridioides difficile]EKS6785014.1 SHOCT domain-containing protein [Clostridioides difficile]MBY2552173.1 SHOCT domain-containing protein [Clostridioides difficile]MDV9593490.1 SHOCT domain-containing protein [Clostridioides difficile]PTL47158.1 SHOCT domain-containing protein [Clostridioides difficile]PTL50845.1 SHOCT domain-containing protein [Clostridioides difficile]